jgi:hypothetical protein
MNKIKRHPPSSSSINAFPSFHQDCREAHVPVPSLFFLCHPRHSASEDTTLCTMGCWNFTFWDNDECVSFLFYLFQHLALLPWPNPRERSVIAMIESPMGNRVMVRHDIEEFEGVQRVFLSITAKSLNAAKKIDPAFKKKSYRNPTF